MFIVGIGFDKGLVDIVDPNSRTGVDQGIDGRHEGRCQGGDNKAKEPGVLVQGLPGDDDESVEGILDMDGVDPLEDPALGGLLDHQRLGQPADGAHYDG